MAENEKSGDSGGFGFLKMLMGGKDYDERMSDREEQIRQGVLNYLERKELPFTRRLHYCQQWIEKTLADKQANKVEKEGLSERHRRQMEEDRGKEDTEKDKMAEGFTALAWLTTFAKAGEVEDEIMILERLREEIQMTLEVPEDRIDQGEFNRRMMDIIRLPRNNRRDPGG